MSDIAIRCEGLGKKYRRGERAPYLRFSETLSSLAHTAARPFLGHRTNRRTSSPDNHAATDTLEPPDPDPATPTTPDHDWFWALKDINLEVKKGEVLGIIGRNGAGKSTLLKILSRITEPTTGHADLYGRVGSLLEVGTGFHPELTGRENIYLNGAVLGMTRPEIRKKFDEIVDFAGVEKFLDTPVKRYSSGMQTRLGFSVAAHLDPEILIVDEVLAVGDAEFQKKCLGKMDEVAKSGRTVLFVSHNMGAVTRLCQESILLEAGRIHSRGDTSKVLDGYASSTALAPHAECPADPSLPMRLREIRLLDKNSVLLKRHLSTQQPLTIRVLYDINKPVQGVHIFFRLHLSGGDTLLSSGDTDTIHDASGFRAPGTYLTEVVIPAGLLGEGHYSLSLSASVPFQFTYHTMPHAVAFSVDDSESSRSSHIHKRRPGLLSVDLPWTTARLSDQPSVLDWK